ncbi:MAG: site-specific integrase, partial [Ruthenibacterium sp.]
VTVPNGAGKLQREALTAEQQQMVTDTEHRAQLAAMLMMYSGLRRGEATALTWADVDLKAGTIRVNKAVEYVSGQPRVKTTKTEAGIRTVNVPQALVTYLTGHKDENCLYVLHTKAGAMYSAQAWRTLWSSYMTDLNVKYGYHDEVNKYANRKKENGEERGTLTMRIKTFTPHQLRHTFCTLLYLSGVDVMTARDQMGHSNIQTTMSIYTHLDKQYKRNSMQKLDEYLTPCASHVQVSK